MPTRYIKESSRTSKNLSSISDFAERLFWRLITTADDYGRFLACPSIVRSACFPLLDKLSVARVHHAMDELIANNLITLYSVRDRQYGHFCTFIEHQGAPRSKKSKYPDPINMGSESIPSVTPVSAGRCEQTPADVPGAPDSDTDSDTDTNTDLNSLSSSDSSPDRNLSVMEPDPVTDIVTAWNKIPGVKPLRKVGSLLNRRIRSRINDHPEREWWAGLFKIVAASDFLCGRSGDFAASLDWVLGPKNLEKIEAGNYVNRPGQAGRKSSMVDYLAERFPERIPL